VRGCGEPRGQGKHDYPSASAAVAWHGAHTCGGRGKAGVGPAYKREGKGKWGLGRPVGPSGPKWAMRLGFQNPLFISYPL
jgi:hypothetical protein